MPFQKGQSGNPGGRRKPDGKVLQLARDGSLKAVNRLVALVDSQDERVAMSAAVAVIERAYGKPHQRLVGDEDEAPIRILTKIALEGVRP